jgi:SAM-dependent methyltransferase
MVIKADSNVRSRKQIGATEPTVAVVITTFNQAHFLEEAIASALCQTHSADDVIVIDDGSNDAPEQVVRKFPDVRLLRQANGGQSAARNVGIGQINTDMVVFLDGDDRLHPNALEAGLACHACNEDSALVYGGHQYITRLGEPLGGPRFKEMGSNSFVSLLHGNQIAMHASVMYKRKRLMECGGFNAETKLSEDYELYLRLARKFSIASHSTVVAYYRQHERNVSSNNLRMLQAALDVLHAQQHLLGGQEEWRAWKAGHDNWRRYYGERILAEQSSRNSERPSLLCRAQLMAHVWRASPQVALREIRKRGRLLLARTLPLKFARRLRSAPRPRVPIGRVDFGDLARTSPIDEDFGYGRGTPVDRFYIEDFLNLRRNDIQGRVLEVGDDSYSQRFGGTRITRQDVLHINSDDPRVTIVGDLSEAGLLPPDSFDCIVLTQTIHLIYDMPTAIAELHAGLRRNGVLLLTVPGITRVHDYPWGDWCWALTQASTRRLLGDVFGPGRVSVTAYGNVFAAVAFLHGCAQEEVPVEKLLAIDPAYPVVIAARAVKC